MQAEGLESRIAADRSGIEFAGASGVARDIEGAAAVHVAALTRESGPLRACHLRRLRALLLLVDPALLFGPLGLPVGDHLAVARELGLVAGHAGLRVRLLHLAGDRQAGADHCRRQRDGRRGGPGRGDEALLVNSGAEDLHQATLERTRLSVAWW